MGISIKKKTCLIEVAENVAFSGSDPKYIPQVKTQEAPPFHQDSHTHLLQQISSVSLRNRIKWLKKDTP